MKARFDITQQTEEWLRAKWGKVGGSSCKVADKTLIWQLMAEHSEPFEMDYDSYISSDMQRGNELEPMARKALNEYLGIELIECGLWECEDNDLLCFSPDGCTSDLIIGCEIKCPQAKTHLKYCIENRLPLEYVDQIIHAFTVNPNLEIMHFLSYRPESPKPMYVKTIYIDSSINVGTESKPVNSTPRIESINSRLRFKALKQDLNTKLEILKF